MVSGSVCKELGSNHSILTANKKLNELKNQQIFLDPSKLDHRESGCPQNWKDQQVDTGNHNLVNQKHNKQKPLWGWMPGRKT